MAVPVLLQPEDDKKILELKTKLKAKSKVEVIRAGLKLLDLELERQEKIKRWKKAAKLASKSSAEINAEFRKNSRIKSVS